MTTFAGLSLTSWGLFFFCILTSSSFARKTAITLCRNGIALHHFKSAVIVVDPVSSSAQLAKEYHAKGVLPLFVRSDLAWVGRLQQSFIPEDFDYDLPAVYRTALESGDFQQALGALKTIQKDFDPEMVYAHGGNESGVHFAERLGAALQLKYSNDPRGIKSHRFKWHMHQALRRRGIKIMPQILTASADQASNWVRRELGGWEKVGKVVVKTGLGAGSTQVVVCHNDAELAEAIRSILNEQTIFGKTNRTVIVQPFIPGREFAINAVSLRDEKGILQTRFTDSWEYIKYAPPLYGHEVLLAYAEVIPELFDLHQRILLGMLVDIGPSHGEYKVTPEGQIYFIENALRFYGSGNTHISAHSTDYGQIPAAADLIANRDHFFSLAGKPYELTHRSYVININVPASNTPLYACHEALDEIEAELKAKGHLFKILRFVEHGKKLDASLNLQDTLAQIEIRIPIAEPNAPAIAEAYIAWINRIKNENRFWSTQPN